MKLAWLGFAAILAVGGCDPEPPKETPPPATKPAAITPPARTSTKPKRDSENRLYPLATLGQTKLALPKGAVKAFVMDTDSKRQEGLMYLEADELKADEGMIFVFPDVAPRAFWMENTKIPLDIVYIRPDGVVGSVIQGKPMDTTQLPSRGEAKYVLELAAGGAARYGLQEGSRVGGLTVLNATQ